MGKISDLFHGITLPQKARTNVLVADKLFSDLQSKIQILESENLTLQAQVNPLKRENETLKNRLAHLEAQIAHSETSEFVEESGALFKRRDGGEYDQTPYCPTCRTAMVAENRTSLFRCGKKSCGQSANFSKLKLGDVMSRLPP